MFSDIVQSGKVNVYTRTTTGLGEDGTPEYAEPEFQSAMSRGEFFGEEGVLGLGTEDSNDQSYIAHSVSSVELVFIPRKDFHDSVQEHPELAQSLARYVYDRHQGEQAHDHALQSGEAVESTADQNGEAVVEMKNPRSLLSKKDLNLLIKIQQGSMAGKKSVAELLGGVNAPAQPSGNDRLDIAHKKQQQDTKDAELVAVLADVTEQQRELQKQVAAMMRLMAEQSARLERVEVAVTASNVTFDIALARDSVGKSARPGPPSVKRSSAHP